MICEQPLISITLFSSLKHLNHARFSFHSCKQPLYLQAEAEHKIVVQQNMQMLGLRANLDKQTTQNNLNNMKLTRLTGMSIFILTLYIQHWIEIKLEKGHFDKILRINFVNIF